VDRLYEAPEKITYRELNTTLLTVPLGIHKKFTFSSREYNEDIPCSCIEKGDGSSSHYKNFPITSTVFTAKKKKLKSYYMEEGHQNSNA
jgi:hypothetical protein